MAVVVVAAAAGPLIAQQKPFVMDQIAERLRYIQSTNPVLQTRIKERKFQQRNKPSSQSPSYPESSSLSKYELNILFSPFRVEGLGFRVDSFAHHDCVSKVQSA
jgi:hypothetical protein